MRSSTLMQCGFILLLALICGLFFNLVMPQGVGLMPPELRRSLYRSVDLKRAMVLYSEGALFFDARDSGDYKLGHIRQAINLPPEEWDRMWPMFRKSAMSAKAVLVYGRYFSRRPAEIVAHRLRLFGLEAVYVLEGGFDEWNRAGYPVRTPRRKKSS